MILVLIDLSLPLVFKHIQIIAQNPPYIPIFLELIVGKSMMDNREIVGQNMNNLHRLSHYIV